MPIFQLSHLPAGRCRGPVLFALAAALAGCGPGRPPIDTITSADTAMNQALNADASELAPAETRVALDKISRAKEAMAEERYGKARRLAEEALVDAQVAEAKARSERARNTLEETRRTIEALQSEIRSRSTGGGSTGTSGGEM